MLCDAIRRARLQTVGFTINRDHMHKKYQQLPRPRIQRAFVRWFRENRSRFAVPVRLTKITTAGILLTFPDHPDCLCAWLSRFELLVSVNWKGVCWDRLIDLDAWPEPVPSGYRCALCMDFVRIWPTREAIWQDHLFDPFLLWVNEKLAHSSQLLLYGRPGETTWAKLVDANDSSPESASLWMSIPFS